MERSRTAHTPWSLIQQTEKYLKQQVGNDCHFIIRPQWSHNYGLIGEFVEVFRTIMGALDWITLQDWENNIDEIINEKIYCISFPRIERLNVLMHANWGHEVGHIIADQWITEHFDQLWTSKEHEIKTRIKQEVIQNSPPVEALFKETFIESIVADKTLKAMDTTRQGLTELICDTVGVHLFGPAALASACEFSAPFHLDENPLQRELYPPWRYRLRLMLKACSEDLVVKENSNKYPGDLIKTFFYWLKDIEHLVNLEDDKKSIERDIITREAYGLIERKWSEILNQALELLPPESSDPYRLFNHTREIEDLVIKLEKDIPPNEIGDWPNKSPAQYIDILNAAWIFKIKKLKDRNGWGSTNDLENLFRLVLKAIEASFVHSVFGGKLDKGACGEHANS